RLLANRHHLLRYDRENAAAVGGHLLLRILHRGVVVPFERQHAARLITPHQRCLTKHATQRQRGRDHQQKPHPSRLHAHLVSSSKLHDIRVFPARPDRPRSPATASRRTGRAARWGPPPTFSSPLRSSFDPPPPPPVRAPGECTCAPYAARRQC